MTTVTSQGLVLPPDTIRDAICRVTDPRFPIDLSAPVRIALTFLLRRVEAGDGSREFWVRRMNFAEIAGRCDKTISNWLGDLERAGLIAKEQRRTTWGAFRSLTVRLTDLAIALLGLEPRSAAKQYSGQKKSSHALLPVQSKETGAGSSVPPPPLSVDRLPPELRCLVRPGMPVSAVFRLMGLATRAGKRLGDVVVACQASIEKARSPFAYVRALLAKDRDFTAIAQSQVESKAEADALGIRSQAWGALAGTDVVRKSRIIRVGAVGEPCQMFEKLSDGRIGAYVGLLCGPDLLKFIDCMAAERS